MHQCFSSTSLLSCQQQSVTCIFFVSFSLTYKSITALRETFKSHWCHCDCFLPLLKFGNWYLVDFPIRFIWMAAQWTHHCWFWLYTNFTAVSFVTVSTCSLRRSHTFNCLRLPSHPARYRNAKLQRPELLHFYTELPSLLGCVEKCKTFLCNNFWKKVSVFFH